MRDAIVVHQKTLELAREIAEMIARHQHAIERLEHERGKCDERRYAVALRHLPLNIVRGGQHGGKPMIERGVGSSARRSRRAPARVHGRIERYR